MVIILEILILKETLRVFFEDETEANKENCMANKSIELKGKNITAPLSLAIKANETVYFSGQLSKDKEGKVVGEGDIKKQTAQTLDNLIEVAKEAGMTLKDIVNVTIYLRNIKSDFIGMNEVYASYFEKPFPARATVEAQLASDGCLIEITAIGVKS